MVGVPTLAGVTVSAKLPPVAKVKYCAAPAGTVPMKGVPPVSPPPSTAVTAALSGSSTSNSPCSAATPLTVYTRDSASVSVWLNGIEIAGLPLAALVARVSRYCGRFALKYALVAAVA